MRAAIPRTARPDIQIVSDRVDAALRPWKLASVLFTMLGIVALVLACVGVYSVMSYVASERIHELGVRVVLGATPRDIVAIVVGGGMRLLGVGILLGVIGAAASARLLSALLFDISPLDPLAYLAAVAALAGVGALASLVPALRVMRADPTIALRSE
jgi:ABC-type antimicrobial peptide transport system permease subunit